MPRRGNPWDGEPDEGMWTLVANSPSPWWVYVEVVERGGRLVVRRLYVTAGDPLPSQGLTARDLRTFPLGTALGATNYTWSLGLYAEVLPPPSKPKEQRGRARDDDFYADVALRYLTALRQARSTPIVKLTKYYRGHGWRDTGVEQVRTWVNLARRYGWLTRQRRGVAGGEPTEKLLAWQKRRVAEQKKLARKKGARR